MGFLASGAQSARTPQRARLAPWPGRRMHSRTTKRSSRRSDHTGSCSSCHCCGSSLITRTGLIAKQGVEIPLENITNVNFSQTVIERVLGAGDLLIESAGTTGQSEFENIPHPDEFQSLLYKVRERRSMELSGKTPPPPQDPEEAIRSLARLRDDGLITDEEYERKRQELLEEM